MVHSMKSCVRYYRINRRDIAMMRFLVEAYEGIALISTIDAHKGLICLRFHADNLEECDMMLKGIGAQLVIEAIDPSKWGLGEELPV